MSKQATKYIVVTGCAKDKPDGTTKRYTAGDVVTTKDFSKQDIEWLLKKGTIKAKDDDQSR
jgi:hypothetical protein